jgi:hypothetical protein
MRAVAVLIVCSVQGMSRVVVLLALSAPEMAAAQDSSAVAEYSHHLMHPPQADQPHQTA